MARTNRREEILQAFAVMLEEHPGARITTAKLAAQIGVSEAALYRHFPSKARMIEGLIEFAENTVFTRIPQILNDKHDEVFQCGAVLWLLLSFCEKNPGFSRLFAGDALQGENARLRRRLRQFYDRIETQLRQILRHAHGFRAKPAPMSPEIAANLILAAAEGRINQFVRSELKIPPTRDWQEQWEALAAAVF